jgi:hypothetical protein
MDEIILHNALDNLLKNTGIKGVWDHIPPLYQMKGFDCKVTLKQNNQKIAVFAIVKKEIREPQLINLALLAKDKEKFIVIAENIFPKVKETLRKLEINYLDVNGNLFLKDTAFYIFIDQPVKNTKKQKLNRAFTKTGLKVIFYLLLNPEKVNATYRELAEATGTGLDTINKVFNGLNELNYLVKVDNARKMLNNAQELLNAWISNYALKLKPGLQLGKFKFVKEEDYLNWKNLPLQIPETLWGGEPAATVVTNYLRPEIFTIYTAENKNNIMKNYKLVPDPNGKIEIYQKFWNDNRKENIVPDILIYADLINTGDPRNIETAKLIYDTRIKNTVE